MVSAGFFPPLVSRLLVASLALPLGSCDYLSSFESVCEKRLAPAKVEVVA